MLVMVSWVFRLATSWVGWRVIPNLVSSQALALFYTYFYSRVLGRQIPRADSSEYQRHRRLIYMLVVFGYALWTFRDAATSIGANYYELLGVNPTADEGDLKLGFRAFARRYHPDRAGPQTETLFMEVRDAYEALKDPLTRFAYDRYAACVCVLSKFEENNMSCLADLDRAPSPGRSARQCRNMSHMVSPNHSYTMRWGFRRYSFGTKLLLAT